MARAVEFSALAGAAAVAVSPLHGGVAEARAFSAANIPAVPRAAEFPALAGAAEVSAELASASAAQVSAVARAAEFSGMGEDADVPVATLDGMAEARAFSAANVSG